MKKLLRLSFVMVFVLMFFSGKNIYAAAIDHSMIITENIIASSYLVDKTQSKFTYHPINLIDETPSTAWFVTNANHGINEWVEFIFFKPLNLREILIQNGYGKSQSLYYDNNRVKTLEIIINGSEKQELKLFDNFKLAAYQFKVDHVSRIRLIIKDVYQGTKYQDTGLTEIQFRTVNEEYDSQQDILVDFDKSSLRNGLNENNLIQFLNKYSSQMNPKTVEEIFKKRFNPLDGTGNDERLYVMLENFGRYKNFISPILKVIYEKSDQGLFASESQEMDSYSIAVKELIKNETGIPLMKKSGKKNYVNYYYIMELGDTRILPAYLDQLIQTGIWHEATCPLMPNELLIKNKDNYVKKTIEQTLTQKQMSEEVKDELLKALD